MADLAASDWTVTMLTRPGRRLVEGVKEAYADIKIGDGAKTYPAGGIPMPDLSVFGIMHDCFFLHIENPAGARSYTYDRVNHKLQMWWGDYSAAADGVHVEFVGAPAEFTLRVKLEGH